MTSAENTRARALMIALALSIACLLIGPSSALSAVPTPIWRIASISNTTAPPGDGNPATAEHTYLFSIANLGDTTAVNSPGDPIAFSVDLPEDVGVVALTGELGFPFSGWSCEGLAPGVHHFSCAFEGASIPHRILSAAKIFELEVSLDPAATATQVAHFTVSGGGAETKSTVDPVRISATPPPFGFEAFDVEAAANPSGAPFVQASGHPYAITTHLDFNTAQSENPFKDLAYPVEATRDVLVNAPAGLIGNPSAFAQCTGAQLAFASGLRPQPECPGASQVGTVSVHQNGGGAGPRYGPVPLFNMVPAVGEPARFGYQVAGTVVILDTRVRSESDYGIDFISPRISEGLAVAGADVEFWGVPTDPRHDIERSCPGKPNPSDGGLFCPPSAPQPAFIRMPTRCSAPDEGLPFSAHAASWVHPGRELSFGRPDLSDPAWKSVSIETHKPLGYPYPEDEWGAKQGTTGCDVVPVKGRLSAQPTALEAETSSGLEVHVDIPNVGLDAPEGIASSDIKAVKVSLPQGVTINPSQAEGLGVCSPAQYESSELSFHPDGNHGCPSDSKIGTVSVKTPLLEETLPGNVYVAKPFDNPFGSLLAIYVVIEEPVRGVLVKLAGKVETDEQSGRIVTSFDDLPQQPFSSFDFKFREGARAPLVTPPTCGTYQTEALFTPWSDPAQTLQSNSSFQITKGIGGGPCPSGGVPPFKPGFSAGSVNNNAGSFSPFNMRLTRSDGEQDMTKFSAVLPPGVLGKLAGLSKCPDSAIATAKAKSGLQEIASPSCPQSSEIGRSLTGAGVGSVLTYVPGKIYLGGPFHGDPLSVIAITPAVAGPFDVGTVVVHDALTLNPKTAEVEVDGAVSDPIPHILRGIPLKLRDLRVYVDRPNFTLNPTSCDPSSSRATLFGSAADVFNPADDIPVALSDRFQAASCASLGFKPRLALKLRGGVKRGGHPGLTATYTPRKGDANVKGLVVRLPRSAFLDQAHIRTICTRVQFAAESCPPGAVYGHIKAFTPLLDEPLSGPVYLRSSNHKLPDLVFDLHGLVDVEVATRIDSVRGGIRATVEDAPDAPITKVLLRMQGAKKGLIVNSKNLCDSTNRASVEFEGQNGKVSRANPELKPECGAGGRRKRR